MQVKTIAVKCIIAYLLLLLSVEHSKLRGSTECIADQQKVNTLGTVYWVRFGSRDLF